MQSKPGRAGDPFGPCSAPRVTEFREAVETDRFYGKQGGGFLDIFILRDLYRPGPSYWSAPTKSEKTRVYLVYCLGEFQSHSLG